ncbi:metalloregulator ArsR/SmtB family transcription factor [Mesorhizobium sp. B2-7-3]|uniref:ArsR/SmtB family transcription factor n=1 Tax=Mesorhizobium sp. B2-7-3 TaxID=2589907 RepID=UPI00112B9AFB|nr:metalloregulator ArsR/SmtB family transcription factor [Mesorhizobium sp. B2-7-3]TPJ14408.1 metalloregulator ArsR/SmtB family transcription factor [Mesorhizobium sp. B2-7-3]
MMKADAATSLYTDLAETARTLGHPHRLVLLEHIAQGERSVERLAELGGLTVANASQHLQHLRRAGFVETRRDGKRVFYRLGVGPIEAVLASLRAYAEHTRAEIRELMADPMNASGKLDSISRDELLQRLGDRTITLLDVRPPEEYQQGHLPGALNIPIEDLELRLAELPADQDIVAYCRGPYCVLSATAADILIDRGFRVRRLAAGFPDWKAAGLPIEVAA